jgi:aminoglycoside phosphotransferase
MLGTLIRWLKNKKLAIPIILKVATKNKKKCNVLSAELSGAETKRQ